MTTVCKDCGIQGMGVHHCEQYQSTQTLHRRQCPYCESTDGFTYNRTDKMIMTVDFTGIALDETIDETIYEHTTRRCINCNESITSYVKSLRLNI